MSVNADTLEAIENIRQRAQVRSLLRSLRALEAEGRTLGLEIDGLNETVTQLEEMLASLHPLQERGPA